MREQIDNVKNNFDLVIWVNDWDFGEQFREFTIAQLF